MWGCVKERRRLLMNRPRLLSGHGRRGGKTRTRDARSTLGLSISVESLRREA